MNFAGGGISDRWYVVREVSVSLVSDQTTLTAETSAPCVSCRGVTQWPSSSENSMARNRELCQNAAQGQLKGTVLLGSSL